MIIDYIVPIISLIVLGALYKVLYDFEKEFSGSFPIVIILGLLVTVWLSVVTFPFLYWLK